MCICVMHSGGYALGREGFSEPSLILAGIHRLLILTFYCKKPALHDVSFYKIYMRGFTQSGGISK